MRFEGNISYTTDLFEAVIRHETIGVGCDCKHFGLFHPNGLWWRFYRKRWPYRYAEMRRYFYCTRCLVATGKRVRPNHLACVAAKPNITLPMPSEREWNEMMRRMRG